MITCHVAHAVPDGLVVQTAEAGSYPSDTWVEVRGRLVPGEHLGMTIPKVIPETIRPIPPLQTPYVMVEL